MSEKERIRSRECDLVMVKVWSLKPVVPTQQSSSVREK